MSLTSSIALIASHFYYRTIETRFDASNEASVVEIAHCV